MHDFFDHSGSKRFVGSVTQLSTICPKLWPKKVNHWNQVCDQSVHLPFNSCAKEELVKFQARSCLVVRSSLCQQRGFAVALAYAQSCGILGIFYSFYSFSPHHSYTTQYQLYK
jgi:hypothetical protein